MDSSNQEQVSFKKPSKKKSFRRRRDSEDEEQSDKTEDGDSNIQETLETHKELLKLRQRSHGVNAVTLALGKKLAPEEQTIGGVDPFKSKTGGMIDMDTLKNGNFQSNDDAYDVGIGTQFSAETNTRDEDAEMLKFIEEEIKKRKQEGKEGAGLTAPKFMTPEEAALMAVPEYLRQSSSNKSEEMLSNQMLSGIPEVDLGVEVKIKNIIATEEAKEKIIRDRLNKKEGPSQFVPTNMAVNFVQHNRFNIDEPQGSSAQNKRKMKEPEKPKKVVVVGAEPELLGSGQDKEKGDKASDDFHFEKFKKQFRRF